VRSCAAFGVQGLLVDHTSASPYLRRAVRGSMGTVFRLPVVEGLDLVEAMGVLAAAWRALPCSPSHAAGAGSARPACWAIFALFSAAKVTVFARLLTACDEALSIPMAPGVDR